MGFLYRKLIKRPEAETETELEDVVRNLRYILGTKRGSGSFLPDFGLSETGFRTPEEMITMLSQEIRENVSRYEPRAEILEIREAYEADGTRIRLEVHCRLRGSREDLTVVMRPGLREVEVAPGRPPEDEG